MGNTKTLILPDQESLTRAAALYFAEAAHEAIQDRGQFLVALSSGREIPLLLYEILASPPYKDYLPWDKIHIFWCDEKCLAPTDEESNYSLAWQYWLKHISIPSGNIHRIQGELMMEDAVERYRQVLGSFAKKREWPAFDWILLHLGTFGQVASLYPGYNNDDTEEMVFSIQYPAMGKLADRICISPHLINQARQVVIIASGSSKAEALASTIKGEKNGNRWPAQRIHPEEGLLVWMVDNAATHYSSGRSNNPMQASTP